MENRSVPTIEPVDLKAVATHMAQVEAFSSTRLGLSPDAMFVSDIQATGLGIFRLTVMGEIKKGKSSFINALCGIEGLVPELSDVATSTIFKLHFGQERKYTVFFRKPSGEGDVQKAEIAGTEVAAYGTESGNPHNEKNVDFIAVEAPSPALSEGLVIIDTPGVGGLFKEHRDITWRYAPKSDAIFFITDSVESPIGADEVSFLKELRRITNLIYFVQTKTDKVDRNAVESRMRNNIEILTTQVEIPKEEIVYFAVSSKLKKDADKTRALDDLKDSGFVVLANFLHQNLKATKNRSKAKLALARTATKLEALAEKVAQTKRIFEADSVEKQTVLKNEIHEANQAIEKWIIKGKPELERQLKREFEDIVDDINKDLKRSATAYSEAMQEHLNQLTDAEAVYASVPKFVSDIQAWNSEFVLKQSKELEARIRFLIEGAAYRMKVEMSPAVKSSALSVLELEEVSTRSLEELAEKATAARGSNNLRAGYAGASMGGTIGGIAGAIVGSVIPVIGTTIGGGVGTLIGGLWGGYSGVAEHRVANTERARAECFSKLNTYLATVVNAVQSDLKKLSRRLSDQASDGISEILLESQKRLSDQKKEVEARAKVEVGALRAQEVSIQSAERELHSLLEKQLYFEKQLVQ